MTEEKEKPLRCNECNHQVELIPYTSTESGVGTSNTVYSKYRHRQPHKECSCTLPNMGDNGVH